MVNISTLNSTIISSASSAAKEEQQASIRNLVTGQRQDANVADKSVGTGLSIDVSVLNVAEQTAAAAVNLLKTALGAYDTALSNLTQLKNLAVSAANDALSDTERGFLNQEFQTLVSEIDRIADTTEFNGKTLIDGALSGVANVATATSLSTDNQGLIASQSFNLEGTVLSGDLSTTTNVNSTNVLTFTSDGSDGTEVITIEGVTTADSDAISFSSGTTATEAAANFVTAARDLAGGGETGIELFNFVDNGDGTVTVIAAEGTSNTQLSAVTFEQTTDAGTTISIGNDGTALTDLGGGAQAFTENQATNSAGALGTFSAIEAYNVGVEKSTVNLEFAGDGTTGSIDITITDVSGQVEGVDPGDTVILELAYSAAQAADIDVVVADLLLAFDSQTTGGTATITYGGTADATQRAAILASLTAERVALNGTDNDVLQLSSANAGTGLSDFTFQATDVTGLGANDSVLFGGLDGETARSFGDGTSIAGSDRNVTRANSTADLNLIGGLSNFSATFTGGTTDQRNTVQFFVEVNGTTYSSQAVDLQNYSISDSDVSDRGDTIRAGTKLIFTNPDAPKDTSGSITDNAFQLTVGSSDITLASVTSAATAQSSVDTIANAFETQLADTVITQSRSLNFDTVDPTNGDLRITDAIGTVLEGLEGFDTIGDDVTDYNQGDIRLITDSFGTAGTAGNIGAFNVDRLTDTISVVVDGETYTAYLNSSTVPTTGNVQAYGTDDSGDTNKGSYNSTTKILDLDSGTTGIAETAKLNFYSASTTDGRRLEIDLGSVSNFVSQIDISTDEGELALEGALNSVFGVADNESLSFQIGVASSNTVGVSLGSAKTTDIFLDSAGAAQVLNISTRDNAITASDILDNAINNVISLIADTNAAVSTFDSVTANIQSSKENAQASADLFLATQVDVEVVRQALASVQEQIALNQQTEAIASLENVLSLFR